MTIQNALGFVEVIGLPPAIEAADAALKAANVKLIAIANADAGILTVEITGDVGAVNAAVKAGAAAAERIGQVRAIHVIPRVEQSLAGVVLYNEKKPLFAKKKKVVPPETERKTEVGYQPETETQAESKTDYVYQTELETPTKNETFIESEAPKEERMEQLSLDEMTKKEKSINSETDDISSNFENEKEGSFAEPLDVPAEISDSIDLVEDKKLPENENISLEKPVVSSLMEDTENKPGTKRIYKVDELKKMSNSSLRTLIEQKQREEKPVTLYTEVELKNLRKQELIQIMQNLQTQGEGED